jgi:hypothetical protein
MRCKPDLCPAKERGQAGQGDTGVAEREVCGGERSRKHLSLIARALQPRLQHHDLRAGGRALIEIDHVLIDHADAARRDVLADGPRLEGAVDAVERVLVALPEIMARALSALRVQPDKSRPPCSSESCAGDSG